MTGRAGATGAAAASVIQRAMAGGGDADFLPACLGTGGFRGGLTSLSGG